MNMTSIRSADMPKIAIVGAGAAGLLAAGTAASLGADVTVFEANSRPGKKLLITGKGRCNVTSDSTLEELIANVTKNERFLYSAFSALSPTDLMALIEEHGTKLKTERGRRVFPLSDKSADILSALLSYAKGAKLVFERVLDVRTEEQRAIGVVTTKEFIPFDAVILATGGVSYPLTGSDGSGLRIAKGLGHTVTPLIPSLVPLVSPSHLCQEMQGLSLRNVAITVRDGDTVVYRDFGEMLFTHFGVSGPMILSASAHLRKTDFSSCMLSIDLKPALDEKELDRRLLSDFSKAPNKDFANALGALLPSKMISPFISYLKIDPRRKVHTITKKERREILCALKCFEIPISGFRPIEEAIVTSGGVSVKEIQPKTMESKQIKHLYFAGEMIDVDAYTGGYNLQIAFSTGYLAGRAAAEATLPI
ncbi:MAG: NAD(P)/FAD-dependent oxidoreductase [Clostridia bacterium]|nr:NAD(P)/FAD-dependent oxidoreductase [Clostridia bacterium]